MGESKREEMLRLGGKEKKGERVGASCGVLRREERREKKEMRLVAFKEVLTKFLKAQFFKFGPNFLKISV